MTTGSPKPTLWERSTTRRLIKWLFSRGASHDVMLLLVAFVAWVLVLLPRLAFLLVQVAALIALQYAVENWRGRRAWEQCRRELLAQGEQLDPQAFIPAPIPDDQNFAMTPFLAPVLDIDYKASGTNRWRDFKGYQRAQDFALNRPLIKFSWNKGKPIDLGAWLAQFQEQGRLRNRATNKVTATTPSMDRSRAAPFVLQIFQEYESVLQEIRTASRRPHARYKLAYEQDPDVLLEPHLVVLRRLSSILAVRASALLAAGKPDAAFEEVQVLLALSDTLKNDPLTDSQLVRASCLDAVFQVIWEGLAGRHWSDPQLERLQARLQRIEFIKDMRHALQAERAFICTSFERARNRQQGTIFPKREARSLSAQWAESPLLPSGWVDFELVNLARASQDFLVSAWKDPGRIDPFASDQELAHVEQSIHQGALAVVWRDQVLTVLRLPLLGHCAQRASQVQAIVSEAAIACALERYRLREGQYPQGLEALVPRFIPKLPHDTVGPAPFKYKRADDGQSFLLYSVAWDLRDDGGVPSKNSKGDWVWNSAKTQ